LVFDKPHAENGMATSKISANNSVSVATGITGLSARRSGNLVKLNFYDFPVGTTGTLPEELRPYSSAQRAIVATGNGAATGIASVATNGNVAVSAASSVTGFWYGSITYFTR
jgi:hypothetical protein